MDTPPLTTISTPSTIAIHRDTISTDTDLDKGIGVILDSETTNEEKNDVDQFFKREGELARLMAMRRIEREGQARAEIAQNADNDHSLDRKRALLTTIFSNNTESNCQRYIYNVINVIARQSLSVFIATYLRQSLSYLIATGLEKNELPLSMGIAAAAGLYPVLLNVAGLVRDKYYAEDTMSSTVCRFINIGTGFGAVGLAAYRGVLPDLAPSLVGFHVYCMVRDLIQTYIPLQNGVHELAFLPTLGSAALYGVNQTLSNFLMTSLASPSGELAAGAAYNQIAKNDMFRSFINTGAEAVDLLTMAGLQHIWNGGSLAIKLETDNPSSKQIIKTATGVYTARATLLTNLLLISAIVFSYFDPDQLSDPYLKMLVTAAIQAGIVALGYVIFMGTATRANFGYNTNAQTEGQLIR